MSVVTIPLEVARIAETEAPRPGLWWQPRLSHAGDGRELSQEHTDIAISLGVSREICRRALDDGAWQDAKHEFELVAELWLEQATSARLLIRSEHKFHEFEHAVNDQRGGIHSDPLVRAFARHLWGDRDAVWHEQPICACGHEAGLHIESGVRATSDGGGHYYQCTACSVRIADTPISRCTHSEKMVHELAGPLCTCPTPWNAEAPGRFVRTNCGGVATHSAFACAKGVWWGGRIDATYLRTGIITPDEIARSRFNP